MEIKKSEKANLENKKMPFTLVGLLVALAFILGAFEYTSFQTRYNTVNESAYEKMDQVFAMMDNLQEIEEEEEIIEEPERIVAPPVLNFEDIQTTEDEDIDDEAFFDVDEVPEDLIGEDVDADPILEFVEKRPEFPGGEAALLEYLGKNIQYPGPARNARVQGMVILKFVVEKDGSVGEVQILRGLGFGLDEEATRVVKSLPKFAPAENNGVPARFWFQLPVKFVLQ